MSSIRDLEIGGRRCHLYTSQNTGAPRFILYWGIAESEGSRCGELAMCIDAGQKFGAGSGSGHGRNAVPPYLLLAYEAEDWNRDFSPWPAPAVFGKEDFQGGAGKTLDWLLTCAMPAMKDLVGAARDSAERNVAVGTATKQDIKHFLGGYSLSGLFSLWAFYESGAFDGAASCSGSLWYPGWQDYMKGRTARRESLLYLSLGDKEERTRNQVMARVGDVTRWQYEQACCDENLMRCMLEWNQGGHFNEPMQRMAAGFRWLLEIATK